MTNESTYYTLMANKIRALLSESTIKRNLIQLGYKHILKTSSIMPNDLQKEESENSQSFINQCIDFPKAVFTDELSFFVDSNNNTNTWNTDH